MVETEGRAFPTIDAIDCLIIPPSPALGESLGYLFPNTKGGTYTREDLIAEMDRTGVARAVLSIQSDADRDWVLETRNRYPGRFIAAVGVNPLNGMDEVRRVERYVREDDVRVLRLGPWRIQKPPTDRVYWPIYVKAIELGVPVQINVGIPGPKFPGWTQDPIHVDEVCFHFPELRVVMTHVGYPWTGTVIRNLTRWDNCYLVINSYAPRHLPEELVQYINTRGYTKVMYGTEFPVLTHGRTLHELRDLGLREHVLPQLLRDNALRVFRWD
jgi:uncharacterized protein